MFVVISFELSICWNLSGTLWSFASLSPLKVNFISGIFGEKLKTKFICTSCTVVSIPTSIPKFHRYGCRRRTSCKIPHKAWAAIQEVVAWGKRCSLTIISTIIYNFFNFTSPIVRSLISRNLSCLKFSSSTFSASLFFYFLSMILGIFNVVRSQMKLDIPECVGMW